MIFKRSESAAETKIKQRNCVEYNRSSLQPVGCGSNVDIAALFTRPVGGERPVRRAGKLAPTGSAVQCCPAGCHMAVLHISETAGS